MPPFSGPAPESGHVSVAAGRHDRARFAELYATDFHRVGYMHRRVYGEVCVKRRIDATPLGLESPADASRALNRLVQREASDRVVAIGLRNPWLGDLYHQLLTLPWWAFLFA
jgi:hypothetical protein